MQRLEVSGAERHLYGSLGVKGLTSLLYNVWLEIHCWVPHYTLLYTFPLISPSYVQISPQSPLLHHPCSINVTVSWDVAQYTLCSGRYVTRFRMNLLFPTHCIFCSSGGCGGFLWNVRTCLPHYTASQSGLQ